ncbi:MAG: glycosyltransferase family 4 protein [Gammaproteobacteria bacterium]|nr:glycosyltransferase family 4 protein [Gammaproteobacteria bacterium]
MKKILFLGSGPNNPSVRLRHYDYFKLWEQAGYQPRLVKIDSNFFKLINLLHEVKSADIVVVIRKTLKPWILFFIRKFAKKIIFDFDDAIFASSNGAYKRGRYNRFKNIIAQSDYVWAGNNYLKSEAQKHSKNNKIAVIPTCLDFNKYLNCHSYNKSKEFLDLVWIGSTSTGKYLEAVYPILAKVSQVFPNLRLKIISDFNITYPGLNIISIPWSLETEAGELLSSHIGIAPMVDNSWTNGKCAFKVLQYMASGLPVLTSPVGMNKEVVIDGVTGYLVDSKKDWLSAILKLQDSNFRNTMGLNARKLIKERYDVDTNFSKLREICDSL